MEAQGVEKDNKPQHEAAAAEKSTMSTRKFAIITLGWPILIPVAIVAVAMMGMLIGCGWFLVGMTFFVSASAAAIGICGIAGAVANTANGFGAVTLALGCGFIGFGMTMPMFKIAKEFFNGYLTLSQEITRKFIELKAEARAKYDSI
ncbi:MAG: hypothetical protein K0R57_5549 [Paenibacillaceae bacterium]|jgi:uncharacterized membrane protein|nr:hypothetical protein [Paenibacillaceae bacterium]